MKKKNVLNEETIEIIDEKKEIKKKTKSKDKIEVIEEKNSNALIYVFVSLAIISFLIYFIYDMISSQNLINQTSNLLSMIIILLFIICFTLLCIKNNNKRGNPFIILGSLLLIIYSGFNLCLKLNLINLPTKGYVLNFYNTSITDVYKWQKQNEVEIIELYEYSDSIEEYNIISQDIEVGTLTSKIKRLTITISKGPDYNKELIVPSFINWEYDDVISYLEQSYLNNVTIEFVKSNKLPNTIIDQLGSGTMRRSDPIMLTFSIAEIEPIEIIDFTNQTILFSESWLKKHGFKYELNYEHSSTIKTNNVINQNIKNEIKNPETDLIKLTVSKGKIINTPNIKEMDQEELTAWIISNNLKVQYEEVYNDEVECGDIIFSSIKEGDIVEAGSIIKVVISKGRLEMIKIEDINDFMIWADTYDIKYQLEYEYSNTILKDKIIKISHNQGDIITIDDAVIITISKGKSITIPNFIGNSKTSITKECKDLNISCSFTYGGLTEKIKKDIATKQSKKSGTVISEGTNLVITLSSGIKEKVTLPNFVGKTKTNVTTTCKNLGVTCKFVYATSYSTIPKDTVTLQSKTGIVYKESSITITLSKGPAVTYTVVISGDILTQGNPTKTKTTLKSKLETACPGVTFVYEFKSVNTGIGYLNENSNVKVGSNTFIQGKTYKVIINSN